MRAVSCPQGHRAIQVCFAPNCNNYPFICCSEECECGARHEECQFLGVDNFMKKVTHRTINLSDETKKCVEVVRGLVEGMVEFVRKQMRGFEEWLGSVEMTASQTDFVKRLRENSLKNVKGSHIYILNRQIQHEKEVNKLKYDSTFLKQVQAFRKNFEAVSLGLRKLYLKDHSEQIEDFHTPSKRLKSKSSQKLLKQSVMMTSSTRLQLSLNKSIQLSPQRAKSKMKHMRIYSENLRIDSKITGDVETIRAFFFPKKLLQMKLLYRASENQFRVFRFHQECDNICNTLVIVKTEYGRILGGYTPLPWQSLLSLKRQSDLSMTSFLFSLTFKQKYPLLSQEHAIYCGKDQGPNFGHGADLVIKDKSNINKSSHFNFPSSYSGLDKYDRSRSTYVRLVGHESAYFKTIQWQVFKIILG